MLEIGVKTLWATVVLLQINPYCWEAKACEKRCAELLCSSKFAPNHTAQLSFCLKWGTFLNCPVAQNLRQNALHNCRLPCNKRYFIQSLNLTKTECATLLLLKICPSQTAQLSFCFKLARIVRKLKPVRNCMRNCPVNQNWCRLLKS